MAEQGFAIKIGQDRYFSEGYASENILANAGLLQGDELTQRMTYLNEHIKEETPFMWLNVGQGGFNSKELEGDGQFYWNVAGSIKECDTLIGSDYSGSDKPGVQLSPFLFKMQSGWMKEGWLLIFEDDTSARISRAPEDKGDYWLYEAILYTANENDYMSLSNLAPGKLVRQSVYIVPGRFDVGTETNTQTPARRTNQISKVRFTYRLTGNIANKQVKWFIFPKSMNGDGVTKFWVDYDFWIAQKQNEKQLERFLFQESIYNRNTKGELLHTDRRSGGEPLMTGASVKQIIHAEGNYAGYGIDFSMSMWEDTVADMFYGKTQKVDIIGYAGTKYREDFGRAIEREASNRNYGKTEGDLRLSKTSSGLSFDGIDYDQYRTRGGQTITLIGMPFLDTAGAQRMHPKSGRPLSSHSCYYIAQGLDEDGQPNVQMMSEKGEAKIQGIYRGLTNIPHSWNDVGKNSLNMIQLATERNETAIHERRSVGINIRDTRYTFHHFSDGNIL